VEGRARLRQALIRDKRLPELQMLPAAQTRDKTAVNPQQMLKLVDDLRAEVDFVIIDSPAGIEHGFRNAIAPADHVVIVTTPEVSAVRDADRIIGLVEAAEKPKPRLILNRLRPGMVKRGDMLATEDVLEILAIDLIGIVPEDETIITSTNRGSPVALDEKSQAGAAYGRIARRLLGEEVPFGVFEENTGFLSRIQNWFRSPNGGGGA
jgi:septum site-determining protein MinD